MEKKSIRICKKLTDRFGIGLISLKPKNSTELSQTEQNRAESKKPSQTRKKPS
jgi:hypothetical protein